MPAVVVFETLFGNTALIAGKVAEGYGDGSVALTTDEVTPPVIAQADILIVGGPTHSMSIPTEDSLDFVARHRHREGSSLKRGGPLLREWLDGLEHAEGPVAAFDTRYRGPDGRGGSSSILRRLRAAGYHHIVPAEGFYVEQVGEQPEDGARLLEGELARAQAWGESIAAKVESLAG